MKKILPLILIATIISSCEKNKQPVFSNNGLSGKWELSEFYVSPGYGGIDWRKPTEDLKHTIEFKSNGNFITDTSIYLYYKSNAFEISDSSNIKFFDKEQTGFEHYYQYSLEENNSILIISPFCYEGCAYKYKAIQ